LLYYNTDVVIIKPVTGKASTMFSKSYIKLQER